MKVDLRAFDPSLLMARLHQAKPGLQAQLKMVPEPRPGQKVYIEVEATCLKAGVMVLLYRRQDAWYMVLIRRPSTVLYHKDQIGFPGGQLEPGENFEEAALRETWEELSVDRDRIKIIGHLTPLYIPPSNFCIYPVVATLSEPPSFKPHPEEVAEVIEMPLGHLMDPRNLRRETWTIGGQPVEVPFYGFRHHKIWGATAMVLAEFQEIFESLEAIP
jgi:8-oxo-dGTP pyrophosphatase MutT (NUDIX family)